MCPVFKPFKAKLLEWLTRSTCRPTPHEALTVVQPETEGCDVCPLTGGGEPLLDHSQLNVQSKLKCILSELIWSDMKVMVELWWQAYCLRSLRDIFHASALNFQVSFFFKVKPLALSFREKYGKTRRPYPIQLLSKTSVLASCALVNESKGLEVTQQHSIWCHLVYLIRTQSCLKAKLHVTINACAGILLFFWFC